MIGPLHILTYGVSCPEMRTLCRLRHQQAEERQGWTSKTAELTAAGISALLVILACCRPSALHWSILPGHA